MNDPEFIDHGEVHDEAEGPSGSSGTKIIVIVVVAVLGLVLLGGALLAVVGPEIWNAAFDGQVSVAEAQMSNIEQAIANYRLHNKKLPSSLEELTLTDGRLTHPFMKDIPVDPWGNEYDYQVLGRSRYRLISYGEDGMPDTDDDIVWPPDGDR